MKETRFVKGYFNESKYGYKIKLHKDAIQEITNGGWKPVGDYFQIEVSKKKDGSGYYMKEDTWAPSKTGDTAPPVQKSWVGGDDFITKPTVVTDDLPF